MPLPDDIPEIVSSISPPSSHASPSVRLQPLTDSSPDRPTTDSQTLHNDLTEFIRFFRNLKIVSRRRHVLERARREGLAPSPDFNDTHLQNAATFERLLSENTSNRSEADRPHIARAAVLFYISAVSLSDHDLPNRAKLFAEKSSSFEETFLGWWNSPAHFSEDRIDDNGLHDAEGVECISFVSRMMVVADRMDQTQCEITNAALLRFIEMHDDESYEDQSLYPWNIEELKRVVLGGVG